MPGPEDERFELFVRAWRGWYRTSQKHEDEAKRTENAQYYRIGKKHLESVGFNITEIPHTGSVTLNKREQWLNLGEQPEDIEQVDKELTYIIQA